MGLVYLTWSCLKVRRLRVRQPISIYSLQYKNETSIIILVQEKVIYHQWHTINIAIYQGCYAMISFIYLCSFWFLLIAKITGIFKPFSLLSFPRSLIQPFYLPGGVIFLLLYSRCLDNNTCSDQIYVSFNVQVGQDIYTVTFLCCFFTLCSDIISDII